MKKSKSTVLLILILLLGLSLLLYPTVGEYWNSLHSSRAIANYSEKLSSLNKEDYEHLWNAARTFNENIHNRVNVFALDDAEKETYNQTLNLTGNGIMGYVEIPKIDSVLPVYHGTADAVLQIAVGHLEWTSLPVGGESTHSVMSAHRGLPSAKLFTDLDRLEMGDTFQVTVLDQVLTYQVDMVKVIMPHEYGDLLIQEGMDYCTLFTCTPYGINTHRLLVRGIRIETIMEKPVIYVANEAFRIEPLLVTPAVAAPMVLVFLIHLMVKYREPPKKKEGDSDHAT